VGVIIGLGVFFMLLGSGLIVAMSVPKVVEYSLTHDRNYHATPRLSPGEGRVRIWATRLGGAVMLCGAVACFVYAA
jgi:hypothetical protein